MGQPVTICDVQNQNIATIGLTGSVYVNPDPISLLADTFDGGSLDTTNRWTAGGSVVPTASGTGQALIQPGTTASASSSLVSQPTFPQYGTFVFAGLFQFEAAPIATGNHRFWGIGTQPGSWTATTPLQDAIGFEIDTTGVMRASVYSAGTRAFTQVLGRQITDGLPHLYLMITRPGLTYFCIDNTALPLAAAAGIVSANLTLPVRFHSINGGSPASATPSFLVSAFTFDDQSRQSAGISDGIYPWRKMKILAAGDQPVNNAQGSYPNSPTNVASAASDTAIAAANANRRMLIVSNDSTAKLYLLVDQGGAGVASSSNFTYVIGPGATFEMPNPVSTARIRGIWSAANGSAGVTDISNLTTVGGA